MNTSTSFIQGVLTSDHNLIYCNILHQQLVGKFDIKEFRKTKNINNQSSDIVLMKTLDDGHEIADLEDMVNHYNRSLHDVLDKQAPSKTKKCVIKSSSKGIQ